MSDANDKPAAARSRTALARLRYGGIHLQEDRNARRGPGPRRWRCMLRLKLPCGRLDAERYLGLIEVAAWFTPTGDLRLTGGRNVELHGIDPADVPAAIAALRRAGLALGCDASGLEYNVSGPVPRAGNARLQVAAGLAERLCDKLYPTPDSSLPARVAACLDDPDAAADLPAHPPRKFTVGVALPEDNSGDLLGQDLGLLLDRDRDGIWYASVYAGGGMSLYRGYADSFATPAMLLGRVPLSAAEATVDAAVALVRDAVDPTDARRCRLKYLLAERGGTWVRRRLREYVDLGVAGGGPRPALKSPDLRGISRGDDGRHSLCVAVPGGRLAAANPGRGIAEAVTALRPDLALTPDQNLLLTGLDAPALGRARRLLARHGAAPPDPAAESVHAVTCTGPPHCRRALCESQRALAGLTAELERVLAETGRAGAALDLRLAACPIGCVRPYSAEIGVVGVRRGRYDVFLGGDAGQGRLGDLYVSRIRPEDIVPALRPLLLDWARRGGANEGFGAYYRRRFHRRPRARRLTGEFPAPAVSRVLADILETTDTGDAPN